MPSAHVYRDPYLISRIVVNRYVQIRMSSLFLDQLFLNLHRPVLSKRALHVGRYVPQQHFVRRSMIDLGRLTIDLEAASRVDVGTVLAHTKK